MLLDILTFVRVRENMIHIKFPVIDFTAMRYAEKCTYVYIYLLRMVRLWLRRAYAPQQSQLLNMK